MARRSGAKRAVEEPHYRIGAAARMTGLSTHLIRVWERRYGVLAPDRSSGGARLYSDPELRRLRLLRRAVEGGHAIGQVARLEDDVLERLAGTSGAGGAPAGDGRLEEAGDFADEFLAAIEELDLTRAKRALLRASVSVSPRVLVVEMLGPLLRRVGENWAGGKLCVAGEHIGSALVRDLLGAFLRESTPEADAEAVIATTPQGELHELGALLTAVTASMRGFRVVYLGPNLPAGEIAVAARRSGSRLVALSIVALATHAAAAEIRALRGELGPEVRLVAGGSRAPAVQAELRGKLEVVSSLADFERWLDDHRERGRPGRAKG